MTEKHIITAAKMYEMRRVVKKLYGSTWKEDINFHLKLIPAAMGKYNLTNEIEAATFLAKEYAHMDGNGVFTMKIMAAAVELIEPSE